LNRPPFAPIQTDRTTTVVHKARPMTESDQSRDFASNMLADEVSRSVHEPQAALDRVGMRGIELPVRLAIDGVVALLPAQVDVAVDLHHPEARGIHMSRLYRACNEYLSTNALSVAGLRTLHDALLDSHAGLSRRAWMEARFSLPVPRAALLSSLQGWRQYPVSVRVHGDGRQRRVELGVEVLYSSTCPGSAAMARQLLAQRFRVEFSNRPMAADEVARWLESAAGNVATPHAQRSCAKVQVALNMVAGEDLPMLRLIDAIEAALGTAVQGAVKRVDEQEFARLNGENPLYCEDAARRIRSALAQLPWVSDYRIETAHLESLHPHDAVACVVKGVSGGFVA
jgi:GTP cyclohydrolase I